MNFLTQFNRADAIRETASGCDGSQARRMKRRDLLAHLTRHGCRLVREGGNQFVVE